MMNLILRPLSLAWSIPPSRPIVLLQRCVHLWQANLSDVPSPSFVDAMIPIDQRESLKSKSTTSRTTHAILRNILSRYTARSTGSEVRLGRGAGGKPYVSSGAPQLKFNVAHTGNLAVVAIADCEVGVDIENVRREITNTSRLLQRLTPYEATQVQNAECPDEAFLNIWTRKEAWLKCLGVGIKRGLSTFEVSLDTESQWLVHIDGIPVKNGQFSTNTQRLVVDPIPSVTCKDQQRQGGDLDHVQIIGEKSEYFVSMAYEGRYDQCNQYRWYPD